jgi:hypothetical protein|nr:MAG TPA: hypothetical protein [Caudoviricetes sp.]
MILTSYKELAINGIIGKITPSVIDEGGPYATVIYICGDYKLCLAVKGFHIDNASEEFIENVKLYAQNHFDEFIKEKGY